MRDKIEEKLIAAFKPSEIIVADESDQHIGHAGARPGGNTHFRVTMKSAAFKGLNRVQMQRLVMSELKDEFDAGLHALALHLSSEAGV
ncbi:MAG: BolA family transcriptional regulator [Pseudomonadota bacterium]